MKAKLTITIVLILSFVFIGNIYSQENKKRQVKVETIDGTVLSGTILTQDDKSITIISKNIGEVKIDKDNVKSIEFNTEKNKDFNTSGTFGHIDHPSRYFFSSSAYGLKKGQKIYSNFYIFFNDINFGVTNNFTLGVGMVPLFLFAGTPSPTWVSTKLSLPIVKNKFVLSAGVSAIATLGFEDDLDAALMFSSSATIGSPSNNGTLSMYVLSNLDGDAGVAINLKGKFRISRRSFFMLETYLMGVDDLFIDSGFSALLGLRTMFQGGINLDYGLLTPIAFDDSVFLPFLGVQVSLK